MNFIIPITIIPITISGFVIINYHIKSIIIDIYYYSLIQMSRPLKLKLEKENQNEQLISVVIDNKKREFKIKKYKIHKTFLDIKVFLDREYNLIRRSKIMSIINILEQYEEFLQKPVQERQNLILELEQIIYQETINKCKVINVKLSWNNETFELLYQSIALKILSNLEKDGMVNNDFLIKEILNNNISLSNIDKLSSQDMMPELYLDIYEKIKQKGNVKFTIKSASLYKCPECKKNKCVYMNNYNRSMDEGVSILVRCLECNRVFNG